MVNERLPLDRLKNAARDAVTPPEMSFSAEELIQIRRAVGKRLLEAFNTENVSQVARALGSSPGVIKPYADGDRFPSHEILLQFHRVTGISIHWLMTGEGSKRVQFGSLFTADEEKEIEQMAKKAGRSFFEEVRRLAVIGKDAVRKYAD